MSGSAVDFVFVVARNGVERRLEFDETTTLRDFKNQVMIHLFGIRNKENEDRTLVANEVPSQLRLFWRGVEIKEGASWHIGIIPDESTVLMKDLSPGLTHGQPAIHANLQGIWPEDDDGQ